MNKVLLYGVLLLLLVGTVAAAGVLIRASTPASGLNDQAYYAYQAGDLETAEALYQRSLELEPDYQLARYNLALLYHEGGHYRAAQPHFARLADEHSGNGGYAFDAAVNLVAAMRAEERVVGAELDEAIGLFERAARHDVMHAAGNAAVLRGLR